jgi:hypothetical protein
MFATRILFAAASLQYTGLVPATANITSGSYVVGGFISFLLFIINIVCIYFVTGSEGNQYFLEGGCS